MKYKINSETLELLIPTLRAMPEYQITADIKLVLNIRTNRPYTLSDFLLCAAVLSHLQALAKWLQHNAIKQ